jgi:hypothetical protein
MPNYCDNLLTLTHSDPAMITRAIEAFKRGQFCSEFVPQPEDEEDWYSWNVNNWGTKWDVGNEDVNEQTDPNTFEVSFDSAWTPPSELYETLQEEYGFEVIAYYYEPGCAFCGKFDAYGDHFYKIDGNSEWAKENIPEDIEEQFNIVEEMEYWEETEEEFD